MIFLYILSLFFAFCIFIFFFLFFVVQVIAHFTTDAPFVTIPGGIIDDIVLHLQLEKDSVLYDLGCGDARVLVQAVKKYPTIRAVGVEKAYVPYLLARLRTRKYTNISIRREDIFETNISDASHIFLYLYPHVLVTLFPKIESECGPKTRIASCDFECSGRIPAEVVDLQSTDARRGKRLCIYKNNVQNNR